MGIVSSMSIVWTGIVLASMTMLVFTDVGIVLDTIFDSASSCIDLCVTLLGVYMVWLGVLRVVEDAGVDRLIGRVLSPIVDILFGKGIDSTTKSHIVMNITSSMLGMGNASTPSGISAISGLDVGSIYASHPMIMLLILNVVSIQLVPTTILGIMSRHGSVDSGVMVPILLTSMVTLGVGVILAKVCHIFSKDRV